MIARLQYITQYIENISHAQLAEEACQGGVRWVQLRVKISSQEEWGNIALDTLNVCKKYGAILIINDNAELAKKVGAHGVHLGKEDISVAEARKILGKNFIIGGTANTFEDIKVLANAGADYIGLGPFRFTRTKEKLSPLLGIEGYKKIISEMKDTRINIPLIAIGGITLSDAEPLLKCGVYGIAVSSAISLGNNRIESARELAESMNSFSNTNSKITIEQ